MAFRIEDMALEKADVRDGRRGDDASPSGLCAREDGLNVLDVHAECLRGYASDAGACEAVVWPDGTEHDDAGAELELCVPNVRA